MQSFISETLDDILKETTSFEDVVFVLPSQRAKIFVKQTFKNKISVGFLPEILNIEQFISTVSGVQKADNIQLLFYFYGIYKQVEKKPDDFATFSSWALTVLQDFNELDQHLINTEDIFIYLRDIERLRKWSVKGTFKETDLIKDHYSFLERLNTYYSAFYTFLIKNNIGYQGLIYREAVQMIDSYLNNFSNKKFFFIGFNALNKAEETIFQKVLERGNSEIYWDLDAVFYTTNHQAGKFIRKYKNEWRYYEKNKIKNIGDTFSNPKNIQVVGAAKNTTQIKYMGEVLKNSTSLADTALVLADETLLPIALNSLPKNIEAINITMGYPLKDVPTTSLLFAIFQLHISQEKLQKKAENEFYHKDVIRFLKHPSVYNLIHDIEDFTSKIAKNNQTFISQNDITVLLKEEDEHTKNSILHLFKPVISVTDFISRLTRFITLLKKEANALEKEYLFRFFNAFSQLEKLQAEFEYFTDLKTLFQFFKQLISLENLSFQGEPLKGLQLMGMLETRVLDFETIILTSANEGILPASSQQSSFIPFDVKVEFNLPTYREKDAIFSYHFFRLIQRAKNIFIIYNTEHDVFGSGEKSRFITQLEMLRKDIVHKIISPQIVPQDTSLKIIPKDNAVVEQLKKVAEKGISPSSLTSYLYNPVKFYKQKVLGIKQIEDVEETVAFNTLGTIVHETLEDLYKPYLGQFLKLDHIALMEPKAKDLVVKYFKTEFKNGDIKTGKNRLIFEVAHRFVTNFLKKEKALLKNPDNQLKIIATEENLATEIQIDGLDHPIKLHGNVDRIDELNGEVRIIDYKSGLVNSSELKVLDFENLRSKEQFKAIQVLLYAYLFTKNKKFDFSKPLKAGIYSFKNLQSGFLKINFSSNIRNPDTEITEQKLEEFIQQLEKYILEIYDSSIPFIEPADLKYE